MNTQKVPYLVDIMEAVHKTVIVYADSDMDAEEIAEALRNDSVIDLTADGGSYMLSRTCESTGIADPENLHCYERYCENGRVVADLESTNFKALEQAKQYIRNFLVFEYGKDELDIDPFIDLTNVSLAGTSYEEGSGECNHPYTVDVKADLINCEIRTYINDILVSTYEYDSLRDMVDNFLCHMSFDDLTTIVESEWREYYYTLLKLDNIGGKFPPNREGINSVIFMFHPGCRLQLDKMVNDPYPVPAGTLGTVERVDDGGHIHVRWDTGSSLSLVPGVDEFHVVRDIITIIKK